MIDPTRALPGWLSTEAQKVLIFLEFDSGIEFALQFWHGALR